MLVTAYANGTTAGSPPPKRDLYGGPRGNVVGWSPDAVRRHTKWLYSVDAPALDGVGFAVTLTVRDCPPTEVAWQAVRRAFLRRMERAGMIRCHWVCEWQRRRVPHLHLALYFAPGQPVEELIEAIFVAWLQCAREFRPSFRSQTVETIESVGGWLRYLSKHASRGVAHYQRQGKPDGWEKTGRLWGHVGDWPTIAPMRFDMSSAAYYRYRRLVRAWRLADARTALARQIAHPAWNADDQAEKLLTARRRIVSSRTMLAASDPKLSAVRGVSEWAPEAVSAAFLALLVDDGHLIIQRSE